MRRIAVFALSVALLGVWGCASKPELTMKQKKTIEYLEALADQKDREADRTADLANQQLERAQQLRVEANDYRTKARLVVKGEDIDKLERSLMKNN